MESTKVACVLIMMSIVYILFRIQHIEKAIHDMGLPDGTGEKRL
jgi:hypothetical protein